MVTHLTTAPRRKAGILASVLSALALGSTHVASVAQTLPETDNTAAPYLGVFKDSFGSQDGIVHDNFFAWWLNRSSVYAVVFNGNYTWTEIQGNTSYVNAWGRWCAQHPNSKIVVSVAMLPGVGNTPSSGVSHAKGARGDYDTYFRALATKIRDAGLCDQVIIRLGWEFNGSWYPWRIQVGSAENDARHFAANFCRVSQTMRGLAATSTTDPGKMPANLAFNWCGTKFWNSYDVGTAFPANTLATTTSTGVSYPAYPGDDYVDSVGVDIYDTDAAGTSYGNSANTRPWSSTVLSTAWNNIVGSASSTHNGIAKWQAVANAHGKTMSFPEWGLSTTPQSSPNPAGGFDNPYFIQKMHDYVHNAANNVEFHAYFDVPGASDHRIGQFPAQAATAHPNAAQKYRQLFTPPMPDRTNIGTITATTKADGLNVLGAGAGFSGTADSFYFTARPAATDDMFMVKLTSASVAAGQAGLMVRQDTAAGAINAALLVSNGNLIFQSRTSLNGATTASTLATGVSYPIWLKLVRRGAAITAYSSVDGFNWSYEAAQTLSSLSGTAAIGVAVSSGSASTLNTVGVDNVDMPDLKLGDEANIATKIIKDNADASGVTYTGTWAVGNTRSDRYGADYRSIATTGAASVTFDPGLSSAGLCDVYIHWPADKTFAYNAPITINQAGGSAALTANQEAGASLWVYAGTYQMNASSSVIVNSTANGATTLADAVLFVPLPAAAVSTINFNNYTLSEYSNQDGTHSTAIQDGGATLLLSGNTWKKISFPYAITANTVLEFDFKSSSQGEIHGIGLDTDNGYESGSIFSLFGADTSLGRQNYHNYSGTDWVHYTIPIGSYYTGARSYLFLINDKDASPFSNTSYYRNVQVHE